MNLNGSVALVTGANRGLGARLVKELLGAGAAKIYAASRTPGAAAARAATDHRVAALSLDVTDPASVRAAAQAAPDVSVLVNNAGVLGAGSALNGGLDVFEDDLGTNYLGMLRVTRAFVPVLEQHAPAAVVNVLTLIALAPVTATAGYCASKAAAHSITQALRAELRGRGVLVLGAYPGSIDTDMQARPAGPGLAVADRNTLHSKETPVSHPPTPPPEGTGLPVTPTPVDPSISVVVAATPDLNDAAATRLLHWCEARLHVLDNGQPGISHLAVDLSHTRRATASAVAILDHARQEAERRHVRIHLVGAGLVMATSAPRSPSAPRPMESLPHPRCRAGRAGSGSGRPTPSRRPRRAPAGPDRHA